MRHPYAETKCFPLKDRYAVIKVQIPTALILLAANITLMYFLAFGAK